MDGKIKEKLKIMIVGDASYDPRYDRESKNWGCRGTILALKNMLSEYESVDISDTFYFFDLGSGMTPNLGCDLVSELERLSSHDNFQRFERMVKNCDLVLINGEGAMYKERPFFRAMCFAAYVAKMNNKKTIIINTQVDLTFEPHRKIAEQVYPMVDDMVFRDVYSAYFCKDFMPNALESIYPDAAFRFQPSSESLSDSNIELIGKYLKNGNKKLDLDRGYICLAGSSYFFRNDYYPNPDVFTSYKKLIKEIKNKMDLEIILLDTDGTDARLFNSINDTFALPNLAEDIPTQLAVDLLSGAKAFISGRWHPGIFALVGGTPIINFSANTHKTFSLNEDFMPELATFDANNIENNISQIIDSLIYCINEEKNLRSRIKLKSRSYHYSCQGNLRYLDKILGIRRDYENNQPSMQSLIRGFSTIIDYSCANKNIVSLQRDVLSKEADYQALNEQYIESTSFIEAQNEDLHYYKKELDIIQKSNNKISKEINSTYRDLNKTRNELSKYKSELDQIKSNLKSAEMELTKNKQELLSCKKEVKVYEKNIKQIKGSLKYRMANKLSRYAHLIPFAVPIAKKIISMRYQVD